MCNLAGDLRQLCGSLAGDLRRTCGTYLSNCFAQVASCRVSVQIKVKPEPTLADSYLSKMFAQVGSANTLQIPLKFLHMCLQMLGQS